MGRDNIRRGIYAIALIAAVIIYVAGVFTGVKVGSNFRIKISKDIGYIKSFVNISALDIKNTQLQESIINSFYEDDKCRVISLYLDYLYDELSSYWTALPSRLETYESLNEVSEEYISLKREYMRFSIRYYLLAKKAYFSCGNNNYAPVLYFYSSDCPSCVEQGIEFDELSLSLKNKNITLVVFPLDANLDDDNILLLKEFYNITSLPASVYGDIVIQGKVVRAYQAREFLT